MENKTTSYFLHNHPKMERELNLDENHVIVDRDEWVKARANLSRLRRIEMELKNINK